MMKVMVTMWEGVEREAAFACDQGSLVWISSREYGLFAGAWRCPGQVVRSSRGSVKGEKEKKEKDTRARTKAYN